MKRKLGGREYVFSVPPSVPESLWQKVNAMLNGNKKMSRRNGKHEYLLSGLLKCLTCHQNGHERSSRCCRAALAGWAQAGARVRPARARDPATARRERRQRV
jgi:hypothetical protein